MGTYLGILLRNFFVTFLLAKLIFTKYFANAVYQTVSVHSYFCAWLWEFVCNHVHMQRHMYESANVQLLLISYIHTPTRHTYGV